MSSSFYCHFVLLGSVESFGFIGSVEFVEFIEFVVFVGFTLDTYY